MHHAAKEVRWKETQSWQKRFSFRTAFLANPRAKSKPDHIPRLFIKPRGRFQENSNHFLGKSIKKVDPEMI